MKKLMSVLGVGLVASTILMPFVASAVGDKIGLAVSPPTIELAANPGDTLQNSIRVDNITEDAQTVYVDRKNFEASGEEGQAILTTDSTTYSLAAWINVPEAQAVIPAKSSKVFSFSINVPTNAEPGGHFGSVVFRTKAQPINGQTGVSVGSEVGSLIFLRVAGETKELATIDTFKASKSFYEYAPVEFETRMVNSGSVHFKPEGTVTITNMFGQKVASIPFDAHNVLPGSTRKFTTEWKPRWLFGKYTVTVSVTYGEKKQILTATTTFVGLPYKLVIAVLIGLIIVIGFMFKRRKRLARSFKILFGRD